MRKISKIMLWVMVFTFILMIAALIVAGNFLFVFAMQPSIEDVLFINDDVASAAEFGNVPVPPEEKWFFHNAKNCRITSFDGTKLHGYYFAADSVSNKYAVILHGYKSSASYMALYAKHYNQQGWNILVPEQRAHGLSEGKFIGMGCLERYDMLEWIDFILKRNPNAKIVIHGVSMGASTAMLLCGEESLPANVEAVVADCGYSSVNEQLKVQMQEMFSISSFPLLSIASLMAKIRAGYFFGDGNCCKALKKSDTPILFIHGEADKFVPSYMMQQVFDSASSDKFKLIVKGAVHANSLYVAPELYWSAVDTFIKRYIP